MVKKEPFRVIIESLAHPVYKIYSGSLRKWNYGSLDILVMPGIFHPGWFVTSAMLFDSLEAMDVEGKRLLELGCGTGALACRASEKGAVAFASDVTPAACRNAELNAERNHLEVGIIQSDIFDQMDADMTFDYILVNPPFIPRYPESEDEFAFCCGEAYEYYISLFGRLGRHLARDGKLIIALAKSCEIDRILEIADSEELSYTRIGRKRKWAETNYLYEFSCSKS
jgi:release factor glutamine methyltransferase